MKNKNKKERIKLIDKENRWYNLPKFIRNKLFKYYSCQGIVHVMELPNGDVEPVPLSDFIKNLDKLTIYTTSEKKADQIAFNFLNEKYPYYKGYIGLF